MALPSASVDRAQRMSQAARTERGFGSVPIAAAGHGARKTQSDVASDFDMSDFMALNRATRPATVVQYWPSTLVLHEEPNGWSPVPQRTGEPRQSSRSLRPLEVNWRRNPTNNHVA